MGAFPTLQGTLAAGSGRQAYGSGAYNMPLPSNYNPTGANIGYGAGGPAFPSYNAGSFTGTNMGGLNSGLFTGSSPYQQNFYNMLGKAYGQGGGQILGDIFKNGLFNPQVAAAFLNAQQPGIARGQSDILGAFGDAGARFGSASAIGLGDYQSQVQLNQQQTLAQLFTNAQQQELGLLENVLPTVHQERANQGGLNKVLGGLEVAGGLIGGALTGGAMLPMVGAGLATLSGGGGGGSQANMGQNMMTSSLSSLPFFQSNPNASWNATGDWSGTTPDPFDSVDPASPDAITANAGNVFGTWGGQINPQGNPAFPSYNPWNP